MKRYLVPAAKTRTEFKVKNSRFIATAGPAFSVQEARAFIADIKAEFADASHNVPAYLIGFEPAVTAHCNDDGEPGGTAGRPILAVLQGSGLGDIVVVVTRYFGGTKLGTGGLVRAYGDAVRAVLAIIPKAQKVTTHTVMVAIPYSYFERLRLLVAAHNGQILDESFAADVTVAIRFETERFPAFQSALAEQTNGAITAEIVETDEETIVPL